MKLPKGLKPLSPPFGQYQTDTIGFGIIKDNPGLLHQMGLGKTYCSLNICRWRIQNNNVRKVLIVCPATIMQKWQDEIKEFTEYSSIILHHESRNKRLERIEYFKYNDTHFGIINYEALYLFYKLLSELTIDLIVADESARYIKNINANRTKAIVWLGDEVKYRQILTGTPIANKPLDIWSQFRFLTKGDTFGINFFAWRNYYFKKVNYGRFNKWEIIRNKISELNTGIYSTCIRFEYKDVFDDLPEKTHVMITLKQNKYLAKLYKKVKSQIISEIETESGSSKLNIPHIFTKLIRLQQVTSGYIKDENNDLRNLLETPKLDAVVEEINTVLDGEESVIVWCRFRYTIKLLSKMLGKTKHIIMTGDDNPKEKAIKWKGFQSSKTVNVFIGQVEAGGIGINLFKIKSEKEYQHMLFVENTFVTDHRLQAIGRSYGRIGQNSKCRVVDFIFKNTIDDKIYNTIMNNKKIADLILKGGVTEFLE